VPLNNQNSFRNFFLLSFFSPPRPCSTTQFCFLFLFINLPLLLQLFFFSVYLGSGIAGTLQPPPRGRDIILVVVHLVHDYACFTIPPSCHTSLLALFPLPFFSLSVSFPPPHTCTSTNRLLSPAPAIAIVLSVCILACVFPILSRVVVLLYMGLSQATVARVSHHLYDFAMLS
jgi:hypothetical protein